MWSISIQTRTVDLHHNQDRNNSPTQPQILIVNRKYIDNGREGSTDQTEQTDQNYSDSCINLVLL